MPFVNARDFSGNVLVVRNGRVLARHSYGRASYELGVPNAPNTRFAIGSITKTFTAAGIQRLVELGRLSIADRASRYVPELTSDTSITIEHLLTHTSGVPDYYVIPEYAQRYGQEMPLEAFARVIGAKPLDFKPGTRSNYSNSAYKLLALIIERVSGVSYAEFLRSQIFVPLGLNNTGSLASSVLVPNLATGYNPGFAPELLQTAATVDRSWLEGAGSLYSTADDLFRWAESVRARRNDSRRFGWGPRTRFGKLSSYEQTARIPTGYASYLAVYPDSGLVVVLLSNIQADVVEPLGISIAGMALNTSVKVSPPKPVVTTAASGDSLARYAGRYEVAPGFALTVRNDPNGLLLAGPDGMFLPLNPTGPGRFFFRPLQAAITFPRDSSGAIASLDWGGQFSGRRAR
jgi:CubicO group peptidase (beta-lactamase class C family)